MSAAAMAMPAKPVKRTITLNDGKQVEVTLRGDERLHFYQSVVDKYWVKNTESVLVQKTCL